MSPADLFSFLFDPFALPFMSRALAALLAISVVAGLVGVLVNIRGREFLSDGLTHAIFPGMAVGFIWGGRDGVMIGALVAAAIAAIALTAITRTIARSDAGIAIVLTALFSIGVVVISRDNHFAGTLEALLFGRVLTVTDVQLAQTLVVCGGAALAILLTLKEHVFRAFDPTMFAATGYRAFAVDLLLNTVIALVVVAASYAVGNILVLAFLIIPGAIARLCTTRLWFLFPCAATLCAVAAWLGLSTSYALSVNDNLTLPAAATIVCMLVVAYVFAAVTRATIDGLRGRGPLRPENAPTPATVRSPENVSTPAIVRSHENVSTRATVYRCENLPARVPAPRENLLPSTDDHSHANALPRPNESL